MSGTRIPLPVHVPSRCTKEQII